MASDEQTNSHHYVTDPSQEPQLMAAYTVAIQQKYPFNARRQPTPRGTLSLEEQYASARNLDNEPSVRISHQQGRPAVLRAIEKSAYQLGFGLPQHLEHLSVLSKLGISVPSFRYQVGERAIFAEVDYIQPVYRHKEEALAQPQALQAAAKLPGIISLYQNWSLQQEKGWTLDDIHDIDQYTYGVNCAIPGPQEAQWWLTDIEPLSDNRRINLEKNVDSFYTEISEAQSELRRLTTECPPLF